MTMGIIPTSTLYIILIWNSFILVSIMVIVVTWS